MTAFDPRLVPARGDLAAEHLRGKVEAQRFVAGVARRVIETAAPLRREPNPEASLDTEALYGEAVTVYDEIEGWAWGQLVRDSYVGWMPANALAAPLAPTHRVCAVRTFVYPTPSIKLPHRLVLSMGSKVTVTGADGLFLAVEGGFVFARHLAPLDVIESDPVAVAEQFLGTPYLWGGRTSLGLDCSALVQTAMLACGIACPRDSDMQELELGSAEPGALLDRSTLHRGHLLFWPGHVAMVRDRGTMIHATGHSMTVMIEDLDKAIARVAEAGHALRSVRRVA